MLKYLSVMLLNVLIISQINSFGQSIIRSSLNCLGSSYSNDGLFLRQTIGQSSNTLVVSNGSIILRQGFQQPLSSENIPLFSAPIEFKLSPNPAKDKVLLELSGNISSYSITVNYINGTPLSEMPGQTLLVNWLDLKDYMPGMYIITIKSNKRIGSKKLIISPQR